MKKILFVISLLYLSTVFVNAELSEKEYVELLTMAISRPLFMLKAENIKRAPENVLKIYAKSIEARRRLCAESPSSTLPVLYALWLNNSYSNFLGKAHG